MLAAPRRCEILPPALRSKVLACLATHFNVRKSVIQSVIKLDRPIVQYGRVSPLKEVISWLDVTLSNKRLRTAGMHLLFEWVLPSFHMCNFWASLLQYTQLVDRHARRLRKTPDFEMQNFFGQLKSYSYFGVTVSTKTWLRWANNGHRSGNSGSQSNIKERHLLLQKYWCWRGCWYEYATVCCRKDTGQRRVGYHWSERQCEHSGWLKPSKIICFFSKGKKINSFCLASFNLAFRREMLSMAPEPPFETREVTPRDIFRSLKGLSGSVFVVTFTFNNT